MNKKVAFFLLVIVFLVSTYFSYSFFSPENSGGLLSPLGRSDLSTKTGTNNNHINNNTEDTAPKTETCPLNGAKFSKTQREKWEKRRPLGVMIENHTDARPQSGLSRADVVYEAVAEGGITRFLAIFYCQDAPYIGPVRSARIYFIKLLQEYGDYPLYAHVGGANTPGPADALGEIRELGWANYNDLNQFSVPFPYFWRDYERLPNRATEHTVYSSTSKLWQYAAEKRELTNKDEDGNSWDRNFTQWVFVDDDSKNPKGEIKKISFGFWENFASDYKVDWVYDKQNNQYQRFNGGKVHLDKNTNKPITAKNVVILFANESPANDGYEGGHILYRLIGRGEALIFQNGNVIKSSWKKQDEESRMSFFNADGKEISFIGGPIWIEILPVGNEVSY